MLTVIGGATLSALQLWFGIGLDHVLPACGACAVKRHRRSDHLLLAAAPHAHHAGTVPSGIVFCLSVASCIRY